MAEMVIAYMSQMHNVALLSRGYGRRTKIPGGEPIPLPRRGRRTASDQTQISARWSSLTEETRRGIRRIRAEHPEVDLIIMDDGCSTVMWAEDQYRDDRRDAPFSMTGCCRSERCVPKSYRAHYFVVTKCPEKIAPSTGIMRKVLIQVAYQRVYFTRFETSCPSRSVPMRPRTNRCTGGRSSRFRASAIPSRSATLRERYEVVQEMTLEDHHVYKVRDLNRLQDLLVDRCRCGHRDDRKDAVKPDQRAKDPEEIRRGICLLPINISFIEDSATIFCKN